jgi:small-conductance mechanosensitive channel
MKPDLLVATVVAGLVSAFVAWGLGQIIRAVGHRRLPSLVTLDDFCRLPFVLTAATAAVMISLQDETGVAAGWRRLSGILVITAVTWLLVRGLRAGEQIVYARLRTDVADNRRVRRARTQVTLMRRILVAVFVLVGLAAVLMSFPNLRTFGASILASAGLAGIVAGLAAQTTLGNVIAGLQLAFTDAVRMDDVVVVGEEWGWIEEITLTYVVLHIWDERRLVLPTSYFTTTPFQNWTRTESRVLGSVLLHLDFATPLGPLREHARQVIEASPLWDQKDWVLQVVDTTETAMVVRVLASAQDAPSSWDLRCDIREALLSWLQEHHPQSLPVHRVVLPAERPHLPVAADGGPTRGRADGHDVGPEHPSASAFPPESAPPETAPPETPDVAEATSLRPAHPG